MAELKASIRTYTDARPRLKSYLSDSQVDLTVTRREGSTVRTSIFEDGSGMLRVERGGKVYTIRWSGDDPSRPDDIEVFADFDGLECGIVPTEQSHG